MTVKKIVEPLDLDRRPPGAAPAGLGFVDQPRAVKTSAAHPRHRRRSREAVFQQHGQIGEPRRIRSCGAQSSPRIFTVDCISVAPPWLPR
ncbi:MAG: hypothetical protein IPG56_17315 [Caulobacteraceae bacterium]|nr:hypothetical protein [Caulobacteraceae bacterium]